MTPEQTENIHMWTLSPVQVSALEPVFTSCLKQAKIHLQLAQHEILQNVAQSCVDAFSHAAEEISQSAQIPAITSGIDSHALEAPERNELTRAVANIYGFLALPYYEAESPHSAAALRALHPIEAKLFEMNLCFST